MHVTYDSQADAAYIALTPAEVGRSVWNPEVVTAAGSVILDIDADGRLLGIEVLGASDMLDANVLERADQLAP